MEHVLPLSATEIEQRLRRLPEHVADQTYNPESEHPQSGKAVAEALSNVLKEEDNIVSTTADIVCGSLNLQDSRINFVRDILFSNDVTISSYDYDDGLLFKAGFEGTVKLGNIAEGELDTEAVTVKQLRDVQESIVAVQIVTWGADD